MHAACLMLIYLFTWHEEKKWTIMLLIQTGSKCLHGRITDRFFFFLKERITDRLYIMNMYAFNQYHQYVCYGVQICVILVLLWFKNVKRIELFESSAWFHKGVGLWILPSPESIVPYNVAFSLLILDHPHITIIYAPWLYLPF